VTHAEQQSVDHAPAQLLGDQRPPDQAVRILRLSAQQLEQAAPAARGAAGNVDRRWQLERAGDRAAEQSGQLRLQCGTGDLDVQLGGVARIVGMHRSAGAEDRSDAGARGDLVPGMPGPHRAGRRDGHVIAVQFGSDERHGSPETEPADGERSELDHCDVALEPLLAGGHADAEGVVEAVQHSAGLIDVGTAESHSGRGFDGGSRPSGVS
jgi:hypothetical protein